MTTYGTLMVVDDDADVLTAARLLLKSHFQRVLTSQDPAEIDAVLQSETVDVFLLDMNFAIGRNTGVEGLQWLNRIKEIDPDAVVVLMTAFGDLGTAVEAMRLGAADFVMKPWQNDKLVATLAVASTLRRTRATVSALAAPLPAHRMIAESDSMRSVLRTIEKVAPTDANVLIRGENGTGKELVAQALHRQSSRAHRVLVAVDLGAVSASLFETELFGHRKGAFTDATTDRAGRFQAAHSGTLFLDEIGNLSSPLQTKLLRVLESRSVTPVGSDQQIDVDVRLIAATNQPLEQLVQNDQFREDLLYRINTIEIRLPPLRDRAADIMPLAHHFLARLVRKYRMPDRRFTSGATEALQRHSWPGNVRELSHAVERAIILAEGDDIDGDALGLDLRRQSATADVADLNLEANERRLVAQALTASAGNVSHAAAALGITRAALYRRIEKFGL